MTVPDNLLISPSLMNVYRQFNEIQEVLRQTNTRETRDWLTFWSRTGREVRTAGHKVVVLGQKYEKGDLVICLCSGPPESHFLKLAEAPREQGCTVIGIFGEHPPPTQFEGSRHVDYCMSEILNYLCLPTNNTHLLWPIQGFLFGCLMQAIEECS